MSSLEKSALDVAFLLTPITNLAMPQVTKVVVVVVGGERVK